MDTWQLLGESQYRKWEVYGMHWDNEDIRIPYSIRGAQNGGALAVKNENDVTIYSGAGQKLVTVNMQVVETGWTEDEELVLVFNDGQVCVLNIRGEVIIPKFMLGHDLETVEICGHALIGLTRQMTLRICADVKKKDKIIETNRLPSEVSALALLAPKFTSSGRLEIFVGTADHSILVVDTFTIEDQLLQSRFAAPIIQLAIAPNGRFVACYTAAGLLTVMSTSFTTKVLDFDTASSVPPLQMFWCGEDSILLNWPNFLLMIGPFGHWIKYNYDLPRCLIPETDSCRIVSKYTCELLQRVPATVETIHRIGSTDLAAMLYDAIEAQNDQGQNLQDPKADENIRSLVNDLPTAISTILQAALAEFDPRAQQLYLRAASYGKNFCQMPTNEDDDQVVIFPSHEFIKTARIIRVLNTLRCPPLALCLTTQQYEAQGLDRIFERLLQRQEYTTASAIAEYLGVPRDKILKHWAIKAAEAGASVQTIRAKAANFTVPAASAARDAGRMYLALQLLASEPFPSQEQVIVLASLQNTDKLAIRKAIDTLDSDVVSYAILNNALDDHTIKPLAQKTRAYFTSAVQSDGLPSTLQKAYGSPLLNQRIDHLKSALTSFTNNTEQAFFAKAIEEQIDLLRIQTELEHRFQLKCFLDMSLAETLYNLIALNNPQATSEALKLQRRFKFPEKHFYYIKIQALAASGQFEALTKFAAEKKSPIGYTPFINACLQHGQTLHHCQQYIARLPLHERFPFYLQLGAWNQALDVAYRTRDPSLLDDIQRAAAADPSADSHNIAAQCDQYRSKLGISS